SFAGTPRSAKVDMVGSWPLEVRGAIVVRGGVDPAALRTHAGDRRDPQSTSTLAVPRHTRTGGPSDGSGLDGPERGLELRHVRDLVGRGRLDRLRLTEVEEVEGHGHTVEVLFAFDVLDRDHHLVDQTVV